MRAVHEDRAGVDDKVVGRSVDQRDLRRKGVAGGGGGWRRWWVGGCPDGATACGG